MIAAFLLSIALCTLILISGFAEAKTSGEALAETAGWARITEEGVYLYATDSDEHRCFVLEKSYYVRLIDKSERMWRVSVMENDADFPRITGWVYASQVKLCDVPPVAPYYPTERLTVTGSAAAVKLSPLPSAETVLVATNSQRLSYYGSITSYGDKWYYVFCGDVMGYVNASSVTSPVISLHPTPLPQQTTVQTVTKPQETPPSKSSSSPASEILLIVFVAVLAVGLTLALFLPGNVKKKSNVFEQDI